MDTVGAWFAAHGPPSVLAGVMIISRNGWEEELYVDAPAGLAELAAGTSTKTRKFT